MPHAPTQDAAAPSGPWALVTGASDGIGAATARALAAEGYHLILAARRRSALDHLADEIRAHVGVHVVVASVDLARPEGVSTLFHAISEAGVGPDQIELGVVAAGFGSSGPFIEADLANELNMLAVNCSAVLQLAHILGRAMVARGAGQLVLFGSLVGFQGNAMSANYSATKAYVQTLAEGLAAEMKSKGVHVLSVAPGPVTSGFADRAQMQMGMADRPEAVARGIVRALSSSGTIRPGFVSKLLGYTMAMTPRPLRIRIMSGVMSGMASNGKDRDLQDQKG
ncbi:MAG: SDR family NAD(P)-dependent oxidoreductase [Pseudomonadota bacterium]